MRLLQETLDSSLLREKELGQQVLQWEHRLQEMADSRLHRETGQLPPGPLPPVVEKSPALLSLESYLQERARASTLP